jgi:hypothetical protein
MTEVEQSDLAGYQAILELEQSQWNTSEWRHVTSAASPSFSSSSQAFGPAASSCYDSDEVYSAEEDNGIVTDNNETGSEESHNVPNTCNVVDNDYVQKI